ncbi:MAG: hypothetical protein HC834_02355 [Rhodospirillales bacterium]|nr:hypothetical protein [Rhodospirillales bacterium]
MNGDELTDGEDLADGEDLPELLGRIIDLTRQYREAKANGTSPDAALEQLQEAIAPLVRPENGRLEPRSQVQETPAADVVWYTENAPGARWSIYPSNGETSDTDLLAFHDLEAGSIFAIDTKEAELIIGKSDWSIIEPFVTDDQRPLLREAILKWLVDRDAE